MIDELTIYNLSIKFPNTVDLVRDVEKMVRADVLSELLSKNWWNTQQRMVMEEWIKNINSN